MRNILILISLLFISCKDDPYQPYRETISKVINAASKNDFELYKNYILYDTTLMYPDSFYRKNFYKLRIILSKFKDSDFNAINFKSYNVAGGKQGIIGEILLADEDKPINGYSYVKIEFSFSNFLGSSIVASVFVTSITDFSEFGDINNIDSVVHKMK